MKIKIIRYPYKEYQIGQIADFGYEKNASLVSLQRAVWLGKKVNKKDPIEEVVKEVVEVVGDVVVGEEKQERAAPKVTNKLQEKVQEKRTGNSFWDNLK